MNKAILLIDMPENCEDCDLFETNLMTHFVPYCYKENRVTKWKGRPDWCPLRDLKDIEYIIVAHNTEYVPSFEFEETYLKDNDNE